ncbi:hypothetical protein [Streptomyces sp. NPDC101166]|uniref:hypothetical protein n=1 Tax=Streptomyces sp. NPDC101166 TaxID=3366120 RepID=UPI003823E376
MRIERHQVGGAAVSAGCEDFTNRIGRLVRSMSRAGRRATYEWQSIAEAYLDHLGALSVETPELDTPEAEAALKDASEAAAGAVAYRVESPYLPQRVLRAAQPFQTVLRGRRRAQAARARRSPAIRAGLVPVPPAGAVGRETG